MPTSAHNGKVLMFQIGAREHYAVARAFHQMGLLDHLVTDLWMPPGVLTSRLPLALRGRWHEELKNSQVQAFNRQCLFFEARARARKLSGWSVMMERNRWFQDRATRWLEEQLSSRTNPPRVVASYSYAASRIFFSAKRLGCKAVMFQIDPGPAEENILLDVERKHPDLIKQRVVAPKEYWSDWKLQCELADVIVVNSEWSRTCLIQAEVAPAKIRIIPLAFQPEDRVTTRKRSYPDRFSAERPLRVLFLGQVNLRKGMGEVIEAMDVLRDEPVEFWIAGPETIHVPDKARNNPKVKWLGTVPRLKIDEYYLSSDVFLFPTISDGFGLTQLEAQACQLPVIASAFCGSVVRDGENGFLMGAVSSAEVVRTLRQCLESPGRLADMSARSKVEQQFGFPAIKQQIQEVVTPLLKN